MMFSFSGIGLPKADDTDAAFRFAEYQHMEPPIKVADGDETAFRIRSAQVLPQLCGVEIEICCPVKLQATLGNVASVFGWVIADFNREFKFEVQL